MKKKGQTPKSRADILPPDLRGGALNERWMESASTQYNDICQWLKSRTPSDDDKIQFDSVAGRQEFSNVSRHASEVRGVDCSGMTVNAQVVPKEVQKARDTSKIPLPKARAKVTNTYNPSMLTSHSMLQEVDVSKSAEVRPAVTSTQVDSEQPLDLRVRKDIEELESVGVPNLDISDQDAVDESQGPEQSIGEEDFMLVGADDHV